MWAYYFFAALLTLQAIISLRGGARYLAYVQREMARKTSNFRPWASVIVPCRGVDQGLGENLAALFEQNYPAYEIIFVTERRDDEALAIFESVRRVPRPNRHVETRVVIAGEAINRGQKVHNLLAAVKDVDFKSRVLVFVDSDARPRRSWLRSLVDPLADQGIGATTGYRWFLPTERGFASTLRSVWNASIASALGPNGDRNFCWGGSMAIRRSTFESAKITDEWQRAASDDFAMMRALRRAGVPIHFAPDCLTASHDNCTFRELVEFTTRQLKITRVYAPDFWLIVLISNLLFVSVFLGGIALIIARATLGLSIALPLGLVAAIYVLGILKAYLRLRAVRIPLWQYRQELRRDAMAHLLIWPLASMLYLFNAIAALFSRRFNWRGIDYELISPYETVIIERNSGIRTQDSE